MSGSTTNLNGTQITINVNDVVPPENFATVDKGNLVGTVYTKEQENEWRAGVEAEIQSGVKGIAIPNLAYNPVTNPIPTPYNPVAHPKGLYEKYDVKQSGTFPNFRDANDEDVVVTPSQITANQAQIWVTNGIAELILKPMPQATKSIPQFANLSFPVTNTATEKVQCVDHFVPYQLLDGKTSTSADTPSTSPSIWKALENRNIRIYEDLPNGTILNEKEQVISNNVQYIALQQAVVGTDLPGLSNKLEVLNPPTGIAAKGNNEPVNGDTLYSELIPINKRNLIDTLNNPLHQIVSIKLTGDSITWGMSATGMASIDPRSGDLTDTRNNSSSNSWANLLHKYIGGLIFNSGFTYTETLTAGAQGGVNIFSYKKEINLLPTLNDISFKVFNNSAELLKGQWVETYYVDAFSKGFLNFPVEYSYDDARIDFKYTGNSFKLRYAQLSDGARYELFINNVSQGIFSTQSGDMGNSSSEGVGFVKIHNFTYVKEADISIRVIAGDPARTLFRIENIIIPREIKVTNQGIIGINADKYLNFIDDVLEPNDDFSFIALGVNDRYAEPGKVNSINGYEKNIQLLIDKNIENNTQVILMCENAVVTESYNFTMSDVRNSLKKIAQAYNLILIDNYKLTYGKLDEIPYLLTDGIHPSEEGHKVIFNNIVNKLF